MDISPFEGISRLFCLVVVWAAAEELKSSLRVREMSLMISMRRAKGRPLHAYSSARRLKSINNKTTQWEAHLRAHCRSITNQLCFLVSVKYLSCSPCRASFKDPLCVFSCPTASFSPNQWPHWDALSIRKHISSLFVHIYPPVRPSPTLFSLFPPCLTAELSQWVCVLERHVCAY